MRNDGAAPQGDDEDSSPVRSLSPVGTLQSGDLSPLITNADVDEIQPNAKEEQAEISSTNPPSDQPMAAVETPRNPVTYSRRPTVPTALIEPTTPTASSKMPSQSTQKNRQPVRVSLKSTERQIGVGLKDGMEVNQPEMAKRIGGIKSSAPVTNAATVVHRIATADQAAPV